MSLSNISTTSCHFNHQQSPVSTHEHTYQLLSVDNPAEGKDYPVCAASIRRVYNTQQPYSACALRSNPNIKTAGAPCYCNDLADIASSPSLAMEYHCTKTSTLRLQLLYCCWQNIMWELPVGAPRHQLTAIFVTPIKSFDTLWHVESTNTEGDLCQPHLYATADLAWQAGLQRAEVMASNTAF
jgi:hypothetical protein